MILVAPGFVITRIWDKAESADISVYASTPYAKALKNFTDFMVAGSRKGYKPERVGQVVWRALTTPKSRVRYEVVQQKLKNWTIPTLLPRRWIDRLVAGQIGLRP